MTTTTTLPAEVRQAVERLSHLDKFGAPPAEEAADVRTLLVYVIERRDLSRQIAHGLRELRRELDGLGERITAAEKVAS